MVKNMPPGSTPKWIPGLIVEIRGPLSFLVDVGDGKRWRRHIDHLKELGDHSSIETANEAGPSDQASEFLNFPTRVPSREPTTSTTATSTEETNSTGTTQTSSDEQSTRYPTRSRQPPDRLMSLVLCN